MDLVFVLPLVVLVVVAVLVARSFVIVPQGGAYVVERLGRYHRTLAAGTHIVLPFLDRIARRHSTSERGLSLGPLPCVSRDNSTCTVDGTLRVAITDASKASYAVADVMEGCTQLARTVLREEIGLLSLDDARESSRHLAGRVVERMGPVAAEWGVRIAGCDISARR